jgi:UDP-3-O-[3-hydroxymyristoyl] N-acetylglucosamine deacetylase
MAALHGCGIDNVMIELDGPEVPAMDGSARPFVTAIEQCGTRQQPAPRRFIQVLQPVCVIGGDKVALLVPYQGSRFSLDIDFAHPAVGFQHFSMALDAHDFRNHIAPARSFGFFKDLEDLRADGLIKGGSLQNALMFDDNGVMNQGGLRFSNECVRHKLLDCIGDLALAGAPILGQFYGNKTGHTINNLLLHHLFWKNGAWRYTCDGPEAETPATRNPGAGRAARPQLVRIQQPRSRTLCAQLIRGVT